MIVLEYLHEDDKTKLKEKEQVWLDSIPNIKENKQYYNLNNYAGGGWHHLTDEHVNKRSVSLKQRHEKTGLSPKELNSYKQKIHTRLSRINNIGFTNKEKEQHSKYGCAVKVLFPSGEIKIFNSFNQASKETGIDIKYAWKKSLKKQSYKGYFVEKLSDPLIPCYKKK
jgi:hypothetical protein